ncbi:hypothetical protein [Shewanella youngdeokensis]|uniref:Porin n=1 Tax=Shewanella youngdeokensis TaxID=2999068 RepID=A0ABZ0K3W9_9GAMM|nr:hypothetical protein RGE70_07705 [Shewanella sp. DAU334]
MNRYILSTITLTVTALTCIAAVQAEVLKQSTSLGTGYRLQIGDDSEASNQFSFLSLALNHTTVADWGSIKVKGKMENVFQLEDEDRRGNEANVIYKTFVDTYYNISDTGIQAWWNEFSRANQKLSEFSNGLGLAYPMKLGALKVTTGVAAAYSVANSPTKADSDGNGRFVGYAFTTTRMNLSYPINNNLTAIALWEARWDRDEDFKAIFKWDESSGHHASTGLKYKFSKKMSAKAVYHYKVDWGGYDEDGQSLDVSFGYKF